MMVPEPAVQVRCGVTGSSRQGSKSPMLSLTSRIVEAAAGTRLGGSGTSITFIDGDTATPVSWTQLHDEAKAVAAGLQAQGIGAGDHVGILGPTTRELVTAIQATWLVGGCVVMLPLPMRMASLEVHVDATLAFRKFARTSH